MLNSRRKTACQKSVPAKRDLAKGQRQAVALAGLIAVKPELLLLDEPTTGFDYSECMEMMAHIKRMNEAGTTVIMVCHDMEVVLDFADRARSSCSKMSCSVRA